MESPAKILIIDDEKGVVQLCQRLLERQGYQVYAALTPKAGLELLDQELVDLLLLDIRMPGMDGFQVMQLARQKQPELAVLIITGHGTIELAVEALRGGADGLTLKPFTADELIQSIQRAIDQNQIKREMSRLSTLKPLFEFSSQLFSELTPSRLRRLVVESICKHLSCDASLVLKLPSNRKFSFRHLVSLIQRQLFYPGELFGAQETQEMAQSLAQIIPRSILKQEPELINIPIGKGVRTLMVAPASLRIPAQNTDHQKNRGELALMRRLGNTQNWLILASVRDLPGEQIAAPGSTAEQSFSTADLELLSILSHQTATAFENALLDSELRAYIRKLKDSQQLLLQAEKLATAGRLMASIAHEINNPLQAVQNCIHLARRSDLGAEKRQEYLDLAQTELERLTKTVQHMLDFYRPTSSDREPTDIHLALKRVIDLMSQKLEANKIEVSLLCDPNLPFISTVKDQIQQVFLNLIVNAIEAMPDGGKLEITVKSLPKKGIEIIFQDNGPGVNPNIRKRIFEPFISGKASGIGLGLSISYGIISAHGGSLELLDPQKQKGKTAKIAATSTGASFRIFLPIE